MLETPLDPLSIRVLGCLIEKQLATPEYYPLTLNALVAACNQSTLRDPVMKVDEEGVATALEELRQRGWVWFVTPAGSRVQKYEQRLVEVLNLSIQESAVLGELLLRGPQTPGELRTRCTRMYAFPNLAEVEAALSVMSEAEPALVRALPRQPGMKETRHTHLLGGEPEHLDPQSTPTPAQPSRLAALEQEVATLKQEMAALRRAFEALGGVL